MVVGVLGLAVLAVADCRGSFQSIEGAAAEHGAAPVVTVGPSIAVLPFADLSEKHGQQYFSEGQFMGSVNPAGIRGAWLRTAMLVGGMLAAGIAFAQSESADALQRRAQAAEAAGRIEEATRLDQQAAKAYEAEATTLLQGVATTKPAQVATAAPGPVRVSPAPAPRTADRVAPLTINADGTYVWAQGRNSVIRGRWRVARPEEMPYTSNLYGGLTLEKAEDGADWTVIRDVGVSRDNRAGISLDRRNPHVYYRAHRIP